MLLGPQVEDAVVASLHQREERLRRVRVDWLTERMRCVFARTVTDDTVAALEVPTDAMVAREVVSVDRRGRVNVLADLALECGSIYALNRPDSRIPARAQSEP